jgi:toxin ParE1/3/4
MTNFWLTRRAARDLRDIHKHSLKQWGEKTARGYIDKLYAAMGALKVDDDRARPREQRALPFKIVAAEKHFIVYEIAEGVPVVLTLLHQRRDIESILQDLTPDFLDEVAAFGKKI